MPLKASSKADHSLLVENDDEDDDDDEEDDANLEPISAENIIQGGRRTRGKQIDFAEAAEKSKDAGDEVNEEEEDDDDDFNAADEDDEMQG